MFRMVQEVQWRTRFHLKKSLHLLIMKKLLFPLIAILTTNLLFAQTDNYKIAIDNFQAHYNAGKFDEIFDSFSPEMKQALPLENTREFLTGLKGQFGIIESKEFISYEQGTYAAFKTKFEKAVLSVNISLDNENQINGMFIKPYEEPKESTDVTVNALSNYPDNIAQIIFTKTRDLPDNAQLSIAVIRDGITDYYGIIKSNDSIKPVNNQDKCFEIGSITKVFTSTILASLVKEKKIKLTDGINTYFPFTFKDNITIHLENLANHTSGLPRLPENLDLSNMMDPYKDYGTKEMEEYLKELLHLENEPSTTFAYSNLGAGLLGYTLGLSQKTSYQKLLQKRIFHKYNMTNSFTSSLNPGSRLVKGLDPNGEPVSNWEFDVLCGAGGIVSTTEDLSKFAKAQFDPKNKELALTRKSTFQINEDMAIGLGWHIIKAGDGENVYWHNGGTGGYSSSMAVDVQKKTAVIILSNVYNINDNIDGLCFELMNEMIQ